MSLKINISPTTRGGTIDLKLLERVAESLLMNVTGDDYAVVANFESYDEISLQWERIG